jgi:enoyl-CoA hydratase/carnithine racemase
VLVMIGHNPLAATALALLLRGSETRPLGAGLAAESAVYSMLQGGVEFAAWRAATDRRDRDPEPDPPVLVERSGHRLDLILNRPHVRNALNSEMRDALLEGLAVAAADDSITDVLIRAQGRSFCSGGDLDEFGSFDDPVTAHTVRLIASIGRAIGALGDRVRVQVHGACAGSGVELPAFAGRVTARPDFTASLPEVSLGLVPGAGGTVSVVHRIGRHRTALLALSGARIDAPTALRWGLIDEIDPG